MVDRWLGFFLNQVQMKDSQWKRVSGLCNTKESTHHQQCLYCVKTLEMSSLDRCLLKMLIVPFLTLSAWIISWTSPTKARRCFITSCAIRNCLVKKHKTNEIWSMQDFRFEKGYPFFPAYLLRTSTKHFQKSAIAKLGFPLAVPHVAAQVLGKQYLRVSATAMTWWLEHEPMRHLDRGNLFTNSLMVATLLKRSRVWKLVESSWKAASWR